MRYLILNDYYGRFGRVVSTADAIAYWGENTKGDSYVTWIAALDPVDQTLQDQPQPWDANNVEVVADKGHLKRWLGQSQ